MTRVREGVQSDSTSTMTSHWTTGNRRTPEETNVSTLASVDIYVTYIDTWFHQMDSQ